MEMKQEYNKGMFAMLIVCPMADIEMFSNAKVGSDSSAQWWVLANSLFLPSYIVDGRTH